MSLPVLTKPVVAKRTPPGPEVITVLGGFALLAGIMLMFAGIVLAVPSHSRWDYGPGLIGFWIMLGFGYVGFAQYLPRMYVAMIVVLAILYLAAGIGFLSGRRWAWTLSIALALVGVASTILQIITWNQAGDEFFAIPGLIVTLLMLVYLATPLARNFFFKRRAGQGPVVGG